MVKTVLVVDDDRSSRDLLEMVLEDVGFLVFSCKSGEEAVDHLAMVDILITDYDMTPGMSGIELAELAKTRRPELPILMVSGDLYSVPNDGLPADRLVGKPFKFKEILSWLKEVLG